MNIYIFEIRRLLKPFLAWSIIVSLMMVLFMAFFPSMTESGMADLAKEMMDDIPSALLEAFGMNEMIDFGDLLQYFGYIAQYILMAASVYAAILGSSALIKEETEGTIEFLYSQPVTRGRIAAMKIFANLTILMAFNILLFIVSVLLMESFREPGYQYLNKTVAIFKGMLAGQIVFLAIGFALSAVLTRFSNGNLVGMGVFFVSYILGSIGAINQQLEWLKYLSPYHYAHPSAILSASGAIESEYIIIMLLVTIIAIAFSFFLYRRKDILV